jgi:glc operon protein GlcG
MTSTLAEAQKVIDGAILKARELNVNICVTVCSPEGHLIALNRMDGAFGASSRASIGKALAAALTGRPSAEIDDSVDFTLHQGPVIWEGAPINRRRGDLPILREGNVDGGCGVCGANSNEEDEICANAGLTALTAKIRPRSKGRGGVSENNLPGISTSQTEEAG